MQGRVVRSERGYISDVNVTDSGTFGCCKRKDTENGSSPFNIWHYQTRLSRYKLHFCSQLTLSNVAHVWRHFNRLSLVLLPRIISTCFVFYLRLCCMHISWDDQAWWIIMSAAIWAGLVRWVSRVRVLNVHLYSGQKQDRLTWSLLEACLCGKEPALARQAILLQDIQHWSSQIKNYSQFEVPQ